MMNFMGLSEVDSLPMGDETDRGGDGFTATTNKPKQKKNGTLRKFVTGNFSTVPWKVRGIFPTNGFFLQMLDYIKKLTKNFKQFLG